MPRIKLKQHPKYAHSTPLKLRVTEINYGGHLGNDAVMGLLHQARVEVLAILGVSEMDLGNGQTGIVQTDCAIVYQGEGFLLDDVLVESLFSEVKGSTFRMCCRISKGEKTLILAEAGFAGFDYSARRTAPLPENFREAIIHS